DIPGPHDTRITFRLSAPALRSLRVWAGQRRLSKVIRHLVLYTFTDGRRAAVRVAAVDTPVRPAASPLSAVPARPPAPPSPAGRPAAPRAPGPPAQPTGPLTAADAFSHLPLLPTGVSYVCEIPGCEFGAGSGAVVRC